MERETPGVSVFVLIQLLLDTHPLYYVFVGPTGVTVRCPGSPGHGSRFVENTAAEKLVSAVCVCVFVCPLYFWFLLAAQTALCVSASGHKLFPGLQREGEAAVRTLALLGGFVLACPSPTLTVVLSRLNLSECFTLGDVTTINMTMVNGGVAYNMIPAQMDVSFDIRIPPITNLQVCVYGSVKH